MYTINWTWNKLLCVLYLKDITASEYIKHITITCTPFPLALSVNSSVFFLLSVPWNDQGKVCSCRLEDLPAADFSSTESRTGGRKRLFLHSTRPLTVLIRRSLHLPPISAPSLRRRVLDAWRRCSSPTAARVSASRARLAARRSQLSAHAGHSSELARRLELSG